MDAKQFKKIIKEAVKEALQEEITTRKKAHQDNYFLPDSDKKPYFYTKAHHRQDTHTADTPKDY